ncbi:MAG: formate dehydrogenase subunit gamma [Burkholderiales bacterium]|nr:formate dehydrogenase subunit gamma [Burkholderiales bacterium]
MKQLYVKRYSPNQRANHWIVAILFFLAAFSGLALFHPSLFWLTAFVGGPQWARILHPYIGIAMFVLFLFMFIMFVGANIWRSRDSEWLGKAPGMVGSGDESKMPKVGKYNGGQKLVFWSMTWCLVVLLITGCLFWQAWFASSVPIWLQRIAVLLHAVAAFVMVLTAIVHIYAAIWVKGTLHAMVRGSVTAGWARRHHALWYEEQDKRGALTTDPNVKSL